MLLYVVEGILLSAFVGGVAAFFARFGGSPIGSDELLYMQTALNNVENLKIADRFTHIYLLKLFLWQSPNALTGARVMWALEIALTALLVYVAARLLGGRGSQLIGVIAIALFLSYPFIATESGGPSVDVTAMLMLAAFVALYLYSAQKNHRQKLLVMALGLVFVLAFKAKETTIVTAVLFIGLGLSDDGHFDWRALKANAVWCAGGIVLGLGLFAALNAVFLRDAFFGIRPGDLLGTIGAYASEATWHPKPDNWYTSYILPSLALPFLLYLLSGIRLAAKGAPTQVRLVWLVPLLLAVLLTISLIRSNWGVKPTYYIPALPVIAILAPQVLDFDRPRTRSEVAGVCWLALLGGLALVGSHFLIVRLSASMQWDAGSFQSTIVSPTLVSIIFGLLLLKPRFSAKAVLLPAILILGVAIAPQIARIRQRLIETSVSHRVEEQFTPFVCFHNDIRWSPGMRMYVSSSIPDTLHYLSHNRDELLSAFNVYFKADSVRSNFAYSTDPALMLSDLSTGQYDYILLTKGDWDRLGADPSAAAQIERLYQIDPSPCESIVFGRRR